MLSENHERAVALLARKSRRDDYGTLLLEGTVIRRLAEIEDPEAWRSEIRRQARADKIRVMTGVTNATVWGHLRREATGGPDEPVGRWALLMNAYDTAQRLGHKYMICRDGHEAAVGCERCDAVGYLNVDEQVIDGDVFEAPCEDDDRG